jgi:phage host-nuclease inhibitor protein Gam
MSQEPVGTGKEPSPLVITSRKEAETAVKKGAQLTALLGVSVAGRDADVLAVQNKHAKLIDKLSGDVTRIKEGLATWAKENRSEFAGSQSLEFPQGELVFRMGQRALELKPGWNWKKVLASMRSWKKYLRPKVEINKVDLLRDSAGEKPILTSARLAKIGVKVVQEESFEVEFRAVPATFKTAKA